MVSILVHDNLPPFVGRDRELATLRDELLTVRSGVPRVVLVEGEAGIGKTVLVEQFLTGESDLLVLRATGEPWEAYVAYGVIDQLMRVAGVSTARLLASRSRSFPTEEPVGVGAWILEELSALEEKATVAVVVDDAHWADMDSLRALLFVVRRLVGERILLVLGHRAEDAPRLPDGLRRLASGRTGSTLTVQALPASDIQQLAGALGVQGFSARAAQRLHAHTAGNPLFVKTMLTELPEQRWRRWSPSLPAPRAFAVQVQRKLEACHTRAPGGWWRRWRYWAARCPCAPPPPWPGFPTWSRRWRRRRQSSCSARRRGVRNPRRRLSASAGPGRGLRPAGPVASGPAAFRGGRIRRGRGIPASAPGAGCHPAGPGVGR